MRAMVVTKYGGPEVLQLRDMPTPVPGDNDLLVEVVCAAMNPVDFKIRTAPRWGERKFPFILGYDVSGIVRGLGKNVTGFKVGDEIYASPNIARDGADAEYVCVDHRSAAHKPKSIDHAHAAALPLVTLTAWESLHLHGQIKAGDTVLIHAGAGGVGHIAIQLAKIHGCTVITTAGRDETVALCKQVGADHVINYHSEDVLARVKEITKGKGVPVVFDGVGKDTFMESLDCLAPLGLMASFGNASGAVPPVNIGILAQKGSLFLTRPTLVNYTSAREDLLTAARELFAVVKKGAVKITINQRYPLREAAQAHRDLEARKTTGSTVLLP